MLLRHLIALIVDAHPSAEGSSHERYFVRRRRNRRLHFISRFREKTSLLRKSSGDVGVDRAALASKRGRLTASAPIARRECPDDLPLHDVIELLSPPRTRQGIGTSSNGRNSAERRGAIIEEDGGARRDRTDDLLLAKQALSQLSYGPGELAGRMLVGLGRFELPTSRLSSARSNQLSYKPQALKAPDAPPAPI